MATTEWNPQRCRRGYRDKTSTDRDLQALHTLLGRTEVTYMEDAGGGVKTEFIVCWDHGGTLGRGGGRRCWLAAGRM